MSIGIPPYFLRFLARDVAGSFLFPEKSVFVSRMFTRLQHLFCLTVIFGACSSFAAPQVETSRLERTNLLAFHNSKGEVVQGKTISDWKKRRAEILAGAQEIMGPLPGKSKR